MSRSAAFRQRQAPLSALLALKQIASGSSSLLCYRRLSIDPSFRRTLGHGKLTGANYGPQCFSARICSTANSIAGGMIMVQISRLAKCAAFGGFLVILAALAGSVSAQADVVKVFDLGGTFSDGSLLSGTLSIDVTGGVPTAIDASVDGFEFEVISSHGPAEDLGYFVAGVPSAGSPPQITLVLPVGSLVNYNGGRLLTQTRVDFSGSTVFDEWQRDACSCPRSRALLLGPHDCRIRRHWFLCRSSRRTSHGGGVRISPAKPPHAMSHSAGFK